MSDDDKKPVIIIKKGGHGGHGHHGGAWKVAFADFVTAMMALFMVLWLVGQSPKTKSAVGAYFRDPLGVAGGGNLEFDTGPQSGGAGFFTGGNTAVAVDTSFSAGNGAEQRPTKELPDLSNARSRLAQALMQLRMDSWSRHVELTAVDEGLRIEIQDTDNESLFPRGGVKVNTTAIPLLETIAKELALLPNHVVIEGHTDSTPAHGKHSNWELSAERANVTRRELERLGLRPEQVVEVRGYASKRPRLWHKPTDARNRRISILVLLQRRELDEAPEPTDEPSTQHPLIKRLRRVDLEAQGPSDHLELEPAGDRQDPL
jgi:chemotaxis protein MotB